MYFNECPRQTLNLSKDRRTKYIYCYMSFIQFLNLSINLFTYSCEKLTFAINTFIHSDDNLSSIDMVPYIQQMNLHIFGNGMQ